MHNPIRIFSWKDPFLPQFKACAESLRTSPLDVPLLISPTCRPWQYLQVLYARDGRAAVLPRLMSLNDVIRLWHADLVRTRPEPASMLDAVTLLHEAVQSLPDREPDPDELGDTDDAADGAASRQKAGQNLARMDLDAFLPWGEKIAGLIDELLEQGIEPADVLACEDEVLPAAAQVLESLGLVSRTYLDALRSRNLTTEGLILHELAMHLENNPDAPLPSQLTPTARRPVFIMGFHTLSTTQERLLRRLWEAGAQVCLHTDPLVADPERRHQAHWICQRHVQWIEAWQADTELVQPAQARAEGQAAAQTEAGAREERPTFSFLSGYDLHSQLEALSAELAGQPNGQEEGSDSDRQDPDGQDQDGQTQPEQDPGDQTQGGQAQTARGTGSSGQTALILPRASLLMPLLHHIPASRREDLNIALGFSLADTPVFQFLHDVLALQTNRDDEGRYHWKGLLSCVDAPLLAGLTGPDGASLLPALRRYRVQLCHGLRFIEPFADVLRTETFDDYEDEVQGLQEFLEVFVSDFAQLAGTRDLADALQRVCDYVQRRGSLLRSTSPVDMEALFHVEHTIIPELRHTLMAGHTLGLASLARIFETLCRSRYLSFEPGSSTVQENEQGSRRIVHRNPAQAPLQVLNVLESTLLSFDRVCVLEATDDCLPGARQHDPLLPDSLRAVLGLPDLNEGDLELGYALHRLCQSSGHVSFYWQEGITRTYLFDGKKSRSRFVEEYIWQQELAAQRVFTPGEPPLQVVSCALTPMPPVPRSLKLVQRTALALQETLTAGTCPLSPSALDKYLECPLAFGFRRLARLRPLAMVNEGDDSLGVGTLIHKVLEDFHGAHLGSNLPDREAAAEELVALFENTLHDPSCLLKETLPPESLAMLEAVAVRKLRKYIENQPEDINPVLLEYTMQASLDVAGTSLLLEGRIDRLDKRPAGLVVLDYKTSKRLPGISPGLWLQDDFFARVKDVTSASHVDAADRAELNTLFLFLRDYAASVQLPCYVTMCRQTSLRLRGRRKGRKDTLTWPGGSLADAAFVALAHEGRETSFFRARKKEDAEDLKERAMELCQYLVSLVVMHMQTSEELLQLRDAEYCARCDFATLCQS